MSSPCNFTLTSTNGYIPEAMLKQRPRRSHARPADLRESVGVVGYEMDFGRLWAEMYDLYGPQDWGWFPIAGGKYERKNGAQWPFFRTEQELDWMRSASRWVAGWNNGHAAGFVGGLCAYVVGKGMECKPTPRDGTNDPADTRLCLMTKAVIDEFAERVLWNELQQQMFNESHIDGDYFLWLFDMGDYLDVRKVFPELVRQPHGTPLDEWGFGVHTPKDDLERVLAFNVMDGDTTSGTVVHAGDLIHIPFFRPGGWTRGIKRGMPLFAHGVKEAFDAAGKVLRNMGEGTAVRQAFAFIEEQAEGTSRDDAGDFVDSATDVEVQRPYGDASRTNKITKAQPGYVPKVSPGYKYVAPPAHPETQAAIEVVDALLRNAVAVMNSPEWLASGNARNMGAYASSMVAESPFVKRMEQVQEYYGGRFLRVLRRVVEIAVRCGRLPRECLTRVRLTMQYPSLVTRNKQEEASTNQVYVGMGVKSIQQVQQELDLDSDKQRAEIAEFNKWKAAEAAKAQPPVLPTQPGQTQPLTPGIGDDDTDPFGEVAESRAAMMEANGFTGVKTYSNGAKHYYRDGKHVKNPSPEEKEAIETARDDDPPGDVEAVKAAEEYKRLGTKALAFKTWFGDWESDPENASKVVNSDGSPREVYHGTTHDFDSFRATSIGEFGPAIYFTSDKTEAESYGKDRGGKVENFKLVNVYLDIKKPYVIKANEEPTKFFDDFPAKTDAESISKAKAAGYDGIFYHRPPYEVNGKKFKSVTHFIAFDPTQIKAVANRGTFDSKSAKIMESTWTPFTGPRGGKGWKSASGVIHYGEHPPEPGEPADKTDDGKADAGKEDNANNVKLTNPIRLKTAEQVSKTIEDVSKTLGPDEQLFVRWSRGPKYDLKAGFVSKDHATGQKHDGLSSSSLSVGDPNFAIRQITSYAHLGQIDSTIYPWIFVGKQVGTDSDNGPVVEPSRVVAVIDRNDAFRIAKEHLVKEAEDNLRSELERGERITDPIAKRLFPQQLEDAKKKVDEAKRNLSVYLQKRGGAKNSSDDSAKPPSDLPHVADLYDRAGRDHATMSVEQIEAAIAEFSKQPKEVVAKVIRDMGFAPQGGKAQMVKEMRQRILDRRSAAQRAAMIEESKGEQDRMSSTVPPGTVKPKSHDSRQIGETSESAKLERCVKDVEAKGNADDAWGVCRASLNEGEGGFTGVKEDSLGRKMYYKDGKHIKGPSEAEKKEIEKADAADGKVGDGVKKPTKEAPPALKIKPTKTRAFEGKPVDVKTPISKQEAGRIGEEVVIGWLKAQGKHDARHMNLDRNNFPIDLIQDHMTIEAKTGLASNSTGAQQWRLTIGEPGKAEKDWLAKASPEEKAAWNVEKQKKIHARKKKVLAALGKELGKPIKAATMTVILNPDTKTADIYQFDGWHDRIGWNSPEAKAAYVGSVTYG